MKKIITAGFIFFLLSIQPAYAQTQSIGNLRKTIREEMKATISINRENMREQFQEKKQNILEQFKDKLKNFKFQARITGTLKAISGNTLTVNAEDQKDYTVNITDQTKLRRRFWGKSELAEFSIGDKLNVVGKWANEEKTIIDAVLVRNASIQKRWGAFLGDVKSKTNDSFIITSKQRGDQTIYFTGETKWVGRDEKAIKYEDILVGHRVRIKGIWDKSLNKVTEVTQVKDFSIPVKPTKAVRKTLNPTISPTLTPTITPIVTLGSI